MSEKELNITHGIYLQEHDQCFTRYSFFKVIGLNLSIIDLKKIDLPPILMETVRRKWKSWKHKLHEYKETKVLEFTYGYNDKYAAITIVSPKDFFKRKIGYQIIKGRLEKGDKVFQYDYLEKPKNHHQIIEVEN